VHSNRTAFLEAHKQHTQGKSTLRRVTEALVVKPATKAVQPVVHPVKTVQAVNERHRVAAPEPEDKNWGKAMERVHEALTRYAKPDETGRPKHTASVHDVALVAREAVADRPVPAKPVVTTRPAIPRTRDGGQRRERVRGAEVPSAVLRRPVDAPERRGRAVLPEGSSHHPPELDAAGQRNREERQARETIAAQAADGEQRPMWRPADPSNVLPAPSASGPSTPEAPEANSTPDMPDGR
jgi:hypothetical protein